MSQIMLYGGYVVPAVPFYVNFAPRRTKWFLIADQFSSKGSAELGKELDPWNVRQEFLNAHSRADLLEWLQSTGVMAELLPNVAGTDLVVLQKSIAFLLQNEPHEWFRWVQRENLMKWPAIQAFDIACAHLKTTFDWSDESGEPFAQIDVYTSLDAIAVTTMLDKLGHTKFGFCQFANCPRNHVFKQESDHERKYCSHRCAAADGARRRRAEAKAKLTS